MKSIKKFVAVMLALSIVMLCGCSTVKEPEQAYKFAYGFKLPASLYTGITVEECYLYSGEYPEDGSFDACENVAALEIKNNSEADIQLMRIEVTTDSKVMVFEVSSLLAGTTVIVLEKSKQTMSENEKITGFQCLNRVDFSEKVSLMEDVFLVQGNTGTLSIKNVSEKKAESDIYVYYKKKDAEGKYFGGITFRAKADGLEPDEIKQLPASCFEPNDSEVLFVDYAG